jgi:uncharacterized membrane protein
MNRSSGENKLEAVIGYILIVGVTISVLIEALGIVSYYYSYRNFEVLFQPQFTMKGDDFFSYSMATAQSLVLGSWTPIHILGFGLVLLMFIPYVRVAASVIYYVLAKNMKYLLITLFVLVILTASLLAH